MPLAVWLAVRVYTVLVRPYPPAFRHQYGRQFVQVFRAICQTAYQRGGRRGLVAFWPPLLGDLVSTLVAEHAACMREALTRGGTMNGWRGDVVVGLALGGLLAVIIVLTNVVFPELTDDHSAVPLAYGVLFLVFAAVGFCAEGRGHRLRSAARAGAVVALVILGLAMLTFIVVDNLFLDIVSRQPEKIAGFQTSGYTSMRDYVNAGLLRGLLLALPMGTLLGALYGLLGGLAYRCSVRLRFQH